MSNSFEYSYNFFTALIAPRSISVTVNSDTNNYIIQIFEGSKLIHLVDISNSYPSFDFIKTSSNTNLSPSHRVTSVNVVEGKFGDNIGTVFSWNDRIPDISNDYVHLPTDYISLENGYIVYSYGNLYKTHKIYFNVVNKDFTEKILPSFYLVIFICSLLVLLCIRNLTHLLIINKKIKNNIKKYLEY